MTFLRIACCALACCTLACSSGDGAPKLPLGAIGARDSASATASAHALLGPAARLALDSGNALFRLRKYDVALVHYRDASALAPQHAAPFFGIYMVARATGNTGMADNALANIRIRNGPLAPVPHASSDSALARMHSALRRSTAQ